MARNITKRDEALLPVTRMVLNDLAVHGGGPITYTEFAARAQQLSGWVVSPMYHVGRMLDYYVASLAPGTDDLAHLVVNSTTGLPGSGYEGRGSGFAWLVKEEFLDASGPVVHRMPVGGDFLTPCCGASLNVVNARQEKVSLDQDEVTCTIRNGEK